jgi:hypothetical protein
MLAPLKGIWRFSFFTEVGMRRIVNSGVAPPKGLSQRCPLYSSAVATGGLKSGRWAHLTTRDDRSFLYAGALEVRE